MKRDAFVLKLRDNLYVRHFRFEGRVDVTTDIESAMRWYTMSDLVATLRQQEPVTVPTPLTPVRVTRTGWREVGTV